MLDTCTWNWLTFLFYAGSVISWFLFMAIYSSIVDITPDMFGVAGVLFGSANFWLLAMLMPAICNLPDVALRYVRRQYNPQPRDIAAEVDRLEAAKGLSIGDGSSKSNANAIELDSKSNSPRIVEP